MSRSPSKKKSKRKSKESKKRSKDHAGVVCKKPKKSALAPKPSEASPKQVAKLHKLTLELFRSLKKRRKKKSKKNKG